MGRAPSEELQTARMNVVPILNDRAAGLSCREIAQKNDVPEHVIHTIMKETGRAGKYRAQRRKQSIATAGITSILTMLEVAADSIVIEQAADGSGWIVTIDDVVSGGTRSSINKALRAAYREWEEERER